MKTLHKTYPTRQHVDAILERFEDDTWAFDDSCAYACQGEEASDGAKDEEGIQEEKKRRRRRGRRPLAWQPSLH